MVKYGQYCPIAKAVEILGDRWTLLIVRDLLSGTAHFNELERGLPGISRGLLAERLRRLQQAGLVEKVHIPHGRQRTAYHLTDAGAELDQVIGALLMWGARWAFEKPEESDLDPVLLMWWMRGRVCRDQLPEQRVVVQFDFLPPQSESYWLVLTQEDVSICQTDPGFGLDVRISAELATLLQIWLGRVDYHVAVGDGRVQIEGLPALTRAFPSWFAYSLAAPAVRAIVAERD